MLKAEDLNLGFKTSSEIRSDDYFNPKYTELDEELFLPKFQIYLQRDLCWDLGRKQDLIITMLYKETIRPICLAEVGSKVYLVDGKNRVNCVKSFRNNEFPIVITGISYFYKDMDTELQYRIQFPNAIVARLYPDEMDWQTLLRNWYIRLNNSEVHQDLTRLKND